MPEPGDPEEPRPPGSFVRSVDEASHDAGTAAPLDHLRAAQLRTRAVRRGLIKVAFGTIFLVGALAHALSPERHEQSSLFWMTLLLLMSTVNVGLGLRSVALARRRGLRSWVAITAAWGLLAVVLLGLLVRR